MIPWRLALWLSVGGWEGDETKCAETGADLSSWRHQMEAFSVLLALCAGNSPVTDEFLTQRPVMRSFDAFFDLRLNKRLSKHSWGWWFEAPSHPLWHHCNDIILNNWCVVYGAVSLQRGQFTLLDTVYSQVRCHYNAIRYNMIFHTAQQWPKQNIHQS